MTFINNIDWRSVLHAEATRVEADFKIIVEIDEAVVLEAERLIRDSISAIGLIQPNVAKVAGLIAFWLRKLKPLGIAADSPNRLLTVNEVVALRIGLAICNAYKDDCSKGSPIKLPARILRDWVTSFRYHSHSPNSSMISFELLMCDA
ncbi:MAG: hypothetical protein LBQ10_02790 [Desulfovibrio sp.]|jgi:hypothetical protein|nr:hypothetical protein [Desulfovibrio sp.]